MSQQNIFFAHQLSNAIGTASRTYYEPAIEKAVQDMSGDEAIASCERLAEVATEMVECL